MSRAVTCSSFFFEVKAVYCVSATSASETQQPSWSSQMACGYLMGCPGVLGNGGDSGPDGGARRGGDREPGPVAADRGDHGGGVVSGVHPHDDGPGAAAGAGGPDGLGGEAVRAAGRGRVPAAQPRGGDHWRGQRGARRGDERVQPADQHGLALDLGVAEPRALLAVPVDPLLRRVDVDEGQHVRAGQQRRPAGEAGQQFPAGLLDLQDVSPGIGAQVRPERGRCAGPREEDVHGPVPQQPMSSIESAPAAMPATRQPTFRCAFVPHPPPGRTCSASSSGRPARSATAITAARPPCDTRFGSSNTAWVRVRLCDNRTCEVSSRHG